MHHMTDTDIHEKLKARLNVQANFAMWSVTREEILALMHLVDSQRLEIALLKAHRTLQLELLKCAAVVGAFAGATWFFN